MTVRIEVIGVIAQGGRDEGVALLTVDGRPAMAFKAGENLGGDAELKRVTGTGVVIEQNGVSREILLPAREAPTGIETVR